ncbi:F0F1 ATP synthase subunit delta [Kaarinaea lacus]
MELNWSTFILEIINFLVLVWILKRFLYKPVLNVIARRKAGIEQTLADAKKLYDDSESLRNQYENRLRDWERERQQARDELQSEIDEQRVQLMQELHASLEQTREKAEVSEQRRLQDLINKGEAESLKYGAQFAARLLEQAAGPDVETRLVKLFIDELKRLPTKRLNALRTGWAEEPNEVHIVSAYPLTESQREELEQAINKLMQRTQSFNFKQDNALLAGLRISIGAWVLGINVRDELKGFTELGHTELSHTEPGHEN